MKLTKNFSLSEFACNDGSEFPLDVIENIKELAINLQILRDYIAMPITINSGYRSPAHNAKIGGVKNSQHLTGMAGDLKTALPPIAIGEAIEFLIESGQMKQGGIGVYRTFVHYDIRGRRARW